MERDLILSGEDRPVAAQRHRDVVWPIEKQPARVALGLHGRDRPANSKERGQAIAIER
jgi:hypothetical protein